MTYVKRLKIQGYIGKRPKKVIHTDIGQMSVYYFIETNKTARQNTYLGIIVSKKVEKTAVQRNFIKRRVRAAFEASAKNIKELSDKNEALGIIFSIKKGSSVAQMEYSALVELCKTALSGIMIQ